MMNKKILENGEVVFTVRITNGSKTVQRQVGIKLVRSDVFAGHITKSNKVTATWVWKTSEPQPLIYYKDKYGRYFCRKGCGNFNEVVKKLSEKITLDLDTAVKETVSVFKAETVVAS